MSAAVVLAAQGVIAAEEPPAEGFSENVSVGYVLVHVSVRSRGGYLRDLTAADFVLRVDGRRVRPASFERGGEAPINLAVLQDLSGSMALAGKLERSRAAVECLLAALKADDRVALATFAGRRLAVEVPFTADREALAESMDGWRAYGVTALHDAVARLADIAPRRRLANAAALLLTDGIENASRLSPPESRALVRGARTPVYVLGLSTPGGAATGGGPTYAQLLRRLADASGGRYFPIADGAAVAPACAEISTELAARYVLGFELVAEGEERYREIRVEVARKGLEIAHRKGYSGRPPA